MKSYWNSGMNLLSLLGSYSNAKMQKPDAIDALARIRPSNCRYARLVPTQHSWAVLQRHERREKFDITDYRLATTKMLHGSAKDKLKPRP